MVYHGDTTTYYFQIPQIVLAQCNVMWKHMTCAVSVTNRTKMARSKPSVLSETSLGTWLLLLAIKYHPRNARSATQRLVVRIKLSFYTLHGKNMYVVEPKATQTKFNLLS